MGDLSAGCSAGVIGMIGDLYLHVISALQCPRVPPPQVILGGNPGGYTNQEPLTGTAERGDCL